jgi:DNA topoisomerase II
MKGQDDERVFQQKSQLEHVKLRPNTYIGSISLHTIPMYVLNDEEDKFILKDIEFSPGLLKIFDEILVNASDHHTNYPDKVKNIKVNFDIETGKICVENDGPGISVVMVDTLHDGQIYKPQAIFSQFLSGDNFNDENNRIVGGTNGLGNKVTLAFSDLVKLETYDDTRKILYTQTFKDRLNIIEPPVVTKQDGKGYTKVLFLPSYKEFCYKKYNSEVGKNILKLIKTRAYQTSAFLGKNCKVWFNGNKLEAEEMEKSHWLQYTEMHIYNDYGIYETTLVHPKNKQLNVNVCIGISDGKFRQISIINGISVYEGGTHIKYITNNIIEYITPKIEAKLAKTKINIHPTAILNNLFIAVKCCVINPEFSSQSKTKLVTPIEKFKGLAFKDKDWKQIWDLLEKHIMSSILGKLKDTSKSRVTRGKIFLKKGNDAKYAGDKKKASECRLIICEGDSALGLTETGINHKNTDLERDYFGTYTIQGVCPNARKEIETYLDIKTNNIEIIRNEKLKNNIRFNDLVKLLGLDYAKTYKESDEFKTLRYGGVVIATDADVDGRGQIFGLIINFFDLFWPELVKRGYITRFNSPMIRAYPKNSTDFVKEFYAMHEYNTWIEKDFNGDSEAVSKKYTINYYKGLASNTSEEIVPMFSNFKSKLNVYHHDDKAYETFEIYFGKETDKRKIALSAPVSKEDIIKCNLSLDVSITDFLNTDVKEFQRDNIMRKLPHIYDGLVQSRRKVLAAARLNKKMGSEKIKVVNFCGEIMSNMGYQHGDASLSQTIIKMAQNFIGSKNLPLLIGVGLFGTRRGGGKDAGSPRYINVKLNKVLTNSLYPTQDDFLLPYVFEDGARVEPEYYLPIVPMSILESMHIPATGWSVKIWARNFDDVVKNVRRMINNEIKKCKKLGIWLRGNESDIRVANDKIYMVGKYTFDKKTNTVKITELPIGVFNDKYIKAVVFCKDVLIPEIKSYEDYSYYDEINNTDHINIQFELNTGAIETIKEKYAAALKAGKTIMFDAPDKTSDEDDEECKVESYTVDPLFDHIEEFFKLRLIINDNINIIGANQEVKEIKYYSTIVNTWFEARKNLYKERITREVVLAKLYIIYLKNIIRFSKERDNLNISNKTLENKFIDILTKNKFDKFDKSMLLNPKYCKVDDLENAVLKSEKSNYNYIIDLTYRSLLKEACDIREKELEKKEQELIMLEDDCRESENEFVGQKTWLNELNELEKIVHKGCTKGWSISNTPPKFKK